MPSEHHLVVLLARITLPAVGLSGWDLLLHKIEAVRCGAIKGTGLDGICRPPLDVGTEATWGEETVLLVWASKAKRCIHLEQSSEHI